MSGVNVKTQVKAAQSGLKASIYSLLTINDRIENIFWAKLAVWFLSPLYILGFLINAGINITTFYNASNKNYFKLFRLISSLSYALIAIAIGVAFFAVNSPYIIIYSYLMGLVGSFLSVGEASFSLFHDIYQYLMAPKDSQEAKAFNKQMIKDGANLLIALCGFLSVFFMLSKSEIIFQSFCLITATLAGANAIWKLSTNQQRQNLQSYPPSEQVDQNTTFQYIQKLSKTHSLENCNEITPPPAKSFFSSRTYRNHHVLQFIRNGYLDKAEKYLVSEIENKIIQLASQKNPPERVVEKLIVLEELQQIFLKGEHAFGLKQVDSWLNSSSLIHQSFFAYVSDTDDLLEAAKILLNYKSISATQDVSIELEQRSVEHGNVLNYY